VAPTPHGPVHCRTRAPGARFVLELPSRHAERLRLGGHPVAAVYPDRWRRRRLATRGVPTARRLTLPAAVRLVCGPPYGPERNPMERVWRARNDARAGLQGVHRAVHHDALARLLQASEAATRPSLTGVYRSRGRHSCAMSIANSYKGQKYAEQGFRFLKVPLFLALSS
jgi:hypothetical protein